MAKFQNVLHTHSGYAKDTISTNFILYIKDASSQVGSKLDLVKQKEQELYAQFGVNSYPQFINIIRQMFQDNGQYSDRTVIRRFEASYLANSLKQFASRNKKLLDKEVRLTIDTSKLASTKVKILDQGIISFECTYKPAELKKKFNELLKTRFHTTEKRQDASTELDKLVDEMFDSGALQIETISQTKNGKNYELYQRERFPNYPWGISKADLDKIEALDWQGKDIAKLREDLQQALEDMRDYIIYELAAGASSDLKKAIYTVWRRNFGRHWTDPIAFFSGTKESNFISKVQGALGEFQTAVIFEYLSEKKLSSSRIAQIQGNVYNKAGEQGKTDVQIFSSLGIQVKNVTTIWKDQKLQLLRDLKTNIHPQKFAQYMESQYQTGFLDFLANYYFNLNYQETAQGEMTMLQEGLSSWLVELMNMAMVDSAVGDTVSFYLIGGKYLVPCSILLEASEELNLKNNISITGPGAKTDEEYRGVSSKNKKPLYQTYWKNADGEWSPTGENIGKYHNLITRGISIRNHFNLFERIEDYALWD